MAENKSLHAAKTVKQDEFYTPLEIVEDELRHYRKHFKDATVLCNCDDPFESNFFKFFALNFNYLGLKKLIATCYVDSPIASGQMSLFDDVTKEEITKKPHKIVITEVDDVNGDGAFDMADVEWLIQNDANVLTQLEGNGDFRSDECKALMEEADIVVTNPPFSLFREYVAQLMEMNKKFLIIGNQNAITYKEIFPLLKDNKVWLGYRFGDMKFRVPDYYEPRETRYWVDETGQKWRSLGNACWFTNLDHTKRHEQIDLFKSYDPEKYPKYDNYNAIEVSKVAEIPCDYAGVMGVPITFLDKYSPDQFTILGLTQRGCHPESMELKKYDDYKEMKPDGTPTGSSGGKTNGNPNLAKNDGRHNYFINAEGHVVQSCYQRIFIRNLHPEEPLGV